MRKSAPTLESGYYRKRKRSRAFVVTFPVGYHMGNPSDKEIQRQILMEALKHLVEITEAGTIVDFKETYYIEGGKCTFAHSKWG